MFRKFTFSKTRKAEFANKMREVEEFLQGNPTIDASASRDSFYFEIDGVQYRVSNHTIEKSNRKAFNFLGEQVRDKYHPDHRDKDTVYIH
ncbi:MAG: hypothetical protein MJ066_06415, partial [Clostridia bacterium]|nr:hypothetical protein [Clostridia bacterium]